MSTMLLWHADRFSPHGRSIFSGVADTAARLLRMLSLLQRRPVWSGPELAEGLGVETRTVRRDVERLRALGYQVDAAPGIAGGYRLAMGAAVPPLLLDEEEATAVAVALGIMASVAVPGVENGALAVLTKLDRLLPPRLRGQLVALRQSTVALLPSMEVVPAEQLISLARACDGHERVTFAYQAHDGAETSRRVEPHRLVATDRRWYLVGFDLDRQAWRTFRVDRTADVHLTGHTFEPRELDDPGRMVSQGIAAAAYNVQARIRIDAPIEVVRAIVPPSVATLDGDGDQTVASIGADRFGWLAGYLIDLGWDFEVVEPPEWRRAMADLGRRLAKTHRP
jgi:predicted DNA-binding transcriptional regulator YafY